MKQRDVINFCKNAMGTVFLLAAAFFVCSTLISIRSVFADPVAPATPTAPRATSLSPRANARTTRASNRTTVATKRGVATRAVNNNQTASSRGTVARTVTPRGSAETIRNVVARATTPGRVSVVASPTRASVVTTSAATQSTYLTGKLYTGNYSNIIDSTTGLISADAYSNCLDSYYTCMDEICTARSDTKGRCSCAGRAVSFLSAEEALEKANEELISLSGQLALLISTKGKDVSSAFQLTDAEKVMNCVSYRENVTTGNQKEEDWYKEHPTWNKDEAGTLQNSGEPYYCKEGNNNFGFDIKNIDGSGSDILASLKTWADAKDMAKSYTQTNDNNLTSTVSMLKQQLANLNIDIAVDNQGNTTLDGLANTWGYHLFEYAHNNVCGRVLDSCFNGIYEACGTPITVKESDGKTHTKCMNGQTSNCPFNYNSYISVNASGDVELNERGKTGASEKSSASCFGYSTSTTSTSDPYAQLRGPVADARRSIMQKYLLDANAACDVYGSALQKTAQNIAYQKVAAQQALQQKRLEFYNEEQNKILSDANSAINNFNNCISELWDCYEDMADQKTWTTARIKTYCAQISQSPSCYQTMICNPSSVQFRAVIDKPDSTSCDSDPYDSTANTCRNIVTIYEILNGTGAAASNSGSAALREQCLQDALGCTGTDGKTGEGCIRSWEKEKPTQSN